MRFFLYIKFYNKKNWGKRKQIPLGRTQSGGLSIVKNKFFSFGKRQLGGHPIVKEENNP